AHRTEPRAAPGCLLRRSRFRQQVTVRLSRRWPTPVTQHRLGLVWHAHSFQQRTHGWWYTCWPSIRPRKGPVHFRHSDEYPISATVDGLLPSHQGAMETGDIALHIQHIVTKGWRLVLYVQVHCDHGITLFEDRPKGQAHCGHGGEAPNLEVVHIRSVIDVSQRIAFIMANRDLTVCFGGHRALFLLSLPAIVWAAGQRPRLLYNTAAAFPLCSSARATGH